MNTEKDQLLIDEVQNIILDFQDGMISSEEFRQELYDVVNFHISGSSSGEWPNETAV